MMASEEEIQDEYESCHKPSLLMFATDLTHTFREPYRLRIYARWPGPFSRALG